MTGGTWEIQNKERPGAYIRFKVQAETSSIFGERGVATIPLILPFGPEKEVIEITPLTNIKDMLGIDVKNPSLLLLKEAIKRASKVLVYRLNKGEYATATKDDITFTSNYTGEEGNKLSVSIQSNIDKEGMFDIITLLDAVEVDVQTVEKVTDFIPNFYVSITGTGELSETAGIPLAGGTDGVATVSDYMDYLNVIDKYGFNTMAVPTNDKDIQSVVVNYIKRLRDDEGKKVQAVLSNYPEADYEGIISVKNGVLLSDNTEIDSIKATAWVAGATAGAEVSESLTYDIYEGAIAVIGEETNEEIISDLKNGQIIFTSFDGNVVVEKDINTLKTYTKQKNKRFSKNRVLRVLDNIANDTVLMWLKNYVQKDVGNDDVGRSLFKKDIIKYLESLQGMGAIQNVVAEDVTVEIGEEEDAIDTQVSIQPVDSMEKLYMEVEVL